MCSIYKFTQNTYSSFKSFNSLFYIFIQICFFPIIRFDKKSSKIIRVWNLKMKSISNDTISVLILWIHLFSWVPIFVDWGKIVLSLIFNFVVLRKCAYMPIWYLLLLVIWIRGSSLPTKSTNIGIQRIIMIHSTKPPEFSISSVNCKVAATL